MSAKRGSSWQVAPKAVWHGGMGLNPVACAFRPLLGVGKSAGFMRQGTEAEDGDIDGGMVV